MSYSQGDVSLARDKPAAIDPEAQLGNPDEPSAELVRAGAVVEKAIEYLLGQDVPAIAVASALLGGSLGLLARTMDDESILRVLGNAAASVRHGELRGDAGRDPPLGHA